MKKILSTLLLAILPAVYAAEYVIPSDRTPATGTWADAGITGGIPERSTIYTTIEATNGSTDQSTEIQDALIACPSGQIVKLGAGTFRCNSLINFNQNMNNIELRGTLNVDGTLATIIDARAQTGINIGPAANFDYPTLSPTVATLTKGATTLTVPSSTDFTNGQLIIVEAANEGETPVFANYGYTYRRAQIAKLKDSGGKPTSTTIEIDAPGLHGNFSGVSAAQIRGASIKTSNSGIRDLRITGANSSDTLAFGIVLGGAYQCYVYNVKSDGATSTPLRLATSYKCEIRRFWAGATDGSTSSYGMLVEFYCTSNLVIDSVFQNSGFGIYQQIVTSGNVYAYNCLVKTTGTEGERYTTLNVNHGPWSQFTLIEGNVGSVVQNDGYFGGAGYTTVFRNWFMGAALSSTTSFYSAAFNRYSRNENLIGNVFGRTGVGGGGYSLGNPNMGNSNSTGTTSMRGALSTLTTRTSDSVGTITAPSGHGITTGATIDVYWAEETAANQRASRIRKSVTVGTVSGTSIPISGGDGDILPSAAAEVYVPTSNTAIIDYPVDWDTTTGGPVLLNAELTTRTDGSNGVLTLDSGKGTVLSAMIAQSAEVGGGSPGRSLTKTDLSTSWVNIVGISNVTGDAATINYTSSDLPVLNTTLILAPGHAGFQDQDMDVIYTLLAKGNYWGLSSGSGIPSVESLGGDTLANSLFLSGTPQFFTDAGLTFPPIDSSSPTTNTYELTPAGQAYVAGWWPASGGGGTQATVTGTTTVTGTLTLP